MSETPPSPSGLPLLGHTVGYARDPFGFVERAVDDHGDVVELDVLGTDGPFVLAHPDHVSVFRLHRDERFFDDPLSFRPDRWLDDETTRPRFASLPFGVGPRRCIGRQFALTEAVLAVASIVGDYRLEWVGDGDLELAPEMTTQPVGAVPMRIRPRR